MLLTLFLLECFVFCCDFRLILFSVLYIILKKGSVELKKIMRAAKQQSLLPVLQPICVLFFEVIIPNPFTKRWHIIERTHYCKYFSYIVFIKNNFNEVILSISKHTLSKVCFILLWEITFESEIFSEYVHIFLMLKNIL